MNQKTKIAVIGLGTVGQLVHVPILAKLNLVELVAVSDINKTRLNSVSDKFNIKTDLQILQKCWKLLKLMRL